MNKKPSETCKEIRKIFIKCSQVIGMHMPDKSAMNPRMAFALFTFILWIVMVVNGIRKSWGNPILVCHSLLPIAFIFVYMGRTYNRFFDKLEERDEKLQLKTEQFYEKWEACEKYRKILLQRVDESAFYTKLLVAATFIFYHLPSLSVDFDNITTGSRLFNMYAFLPYIDTEGDFGFILNSIVLHCSAPVGAFTLIVLDSMFVFYGYQTVPMCDMICIQLEEFGDELRAFKEFPVKEIPENSTENSSKISESEKSRLKSVIILHQEYNEFVKNIVRLMFVPCFTSVIFNSLSIALSIVVTFNVALKLGISCGIMFFSQVLSPCLMGYLIQNQNEKLLQKYCEFPWYHLDRNEKKLYFEFIQVIHNTTVFKLPIFGILNMELFTNVMNASYSYFNYFINFV